MKAPTFTSLALGLLWIAGVRCAEYNRLDGRSMFAGLKSLSIRSSFDCQFPGDSCVGQETGKVFSYKSDCSTYVVCVYGCEIYMKCPAGLHYNMELGVCDYPDKAGCVPATGSTPTPSPRPTPSSTTTRKAPGPGETTNSSLKPTPSNIPTPSQTPSTTRIVTPGPGETTNTGTKTSPGKPTSTRQTSSSGPTSTQRQDSSSPSSTRPTPSIKSTSRNPTPTPKPTSSLKPTSSPKPIQNSCVGIEGVKFLPFIGNCSKFLACDDGSGHIMNCGKGLHFNAHQEACDRPENAGCDPSYNKPEPDPSCQCGGASCSNENDGMLLPFKGSCFKFVACLHGCGLEMKCDNGLHFNKTFQVCDLPERAGCRPSLLPTNQHLQQEPFRLWQEGDIFG